MSTVLVTGGSSGIGRAIVQRFDASLGLGTHPGLVTG
jgi:NAD(P)-dependent dehydrogenase (short-subunit alcohol dehydrogenase family)